MANMKGQQMEDCIFVPQKKNNDSKPESGFYTIFGNHVYLDDNGNPRVNEDSKNTFAKCVSSENGTRYFIKVGLYGKIFNPIGLYSEGRQNKFLSKAGKKEYDYKEVNQKVFDLYVNFLRTKNQAWLNNAERELA